MSESLLLDTDVLIDYLRERETAVKYIENLKGVVFISAMTVAELYAGVREGKERTKLDAFLLAFSIIPVNTEIAVRGGLLRRDYSKSHGTGLNDTMIAATAILNDLTLVTLNKKHFPMVTELLVPY